MSAARSASSSYEFQNDDSSRRSVDRRSRSTVRRLLEELAITAAAIDLRRVVLGQVRLLDSHNQSSVDAISGVVTDAWIEGGESLGRIQISETDAGRSAEGMVARGEVSAISGRLPRQHLDAGRHRERCRNLARGPMGASGSIPCVQSPPDPDALIRSAQASLNTHTKGNRMPPEVIDSSTNENLNEPGGQIPADEPHARRDVRSRGARGLRSCRARRRSVSTSFVGMSMPAASGWPISETARLTAFRRLPIAPAPITFAALILSDNPRLSGTIDRRSRSTPR